MRKTIVAPVFVFFAAALALPLHAELYKWVDKDGKISYSDVPPPKDAKDVKQKKFTDNVSGPNDNLPFAVRDAKQKNPVTLFANKCGEACDGARKLLSGRGIPFTERNPETNLASAEALKKAVGSLEVPALIVGQETYKGFSESTWSAALTQAGYPQSYTPLAPPTNSPPSVKPPKPEETAPVPAPPPAPPKKK
jgi:glutaredoxin